MIPYYQDEHATIYHGDCLDILPALGPGCCDVVFTDPPYGHNNNNGDLIHRWEEALGVAKTASSAARPIDNDGPEANDYYRAALPLMREALKGQGCCCCCCCGGGPDPQFARWALWMDQVFDFKQMVVWDKGPMGLGWHYRRSYETVLVGQKGTPCKWHDDSHRVENIIRPGDYGIKKRIPKADQHPTLKPVELPAHFIRLHSQEGETVLDPFMGSGTTGIAAISEGRRFIGIDTDEHWCQVAAAALSTVSGGGVTA